MNAGWISRSSDARGSWLAPGAGDDLSENDRMHSPGGRRNVVRKSHQCVTRKERERDGLLGVRGNAQVIAETYGDGAIQATDKHRAQSAVVRPAPAENDLVRQDRKETAIRLDDGGGGEVGGRGQKVNRRDATRARLREKSIGEWVPELLASTRARRTSLQEGVTHELLQERPIDFLLSVDSYRLNQHYSYRLLILG